jgi:hypothetical protein
MCSADALKLPIQTPVKESVRAPLSLATANSKELLQHKITKRIEQFQTRPGDVGNSAVQGGLARFDACDMISCALI